MDMLRLVLVRHGFSLGNEKHLLSGWSDVPLTDKGRQELRLLRQQMDYPQTQKYYSSDLCRCTETFQIIYEGKGRTGRPAASVSGDIFRFTGKPSGIRASVQGIFCGLVKR